MVRRILHITMALWWTVWSLLIVPAHTRGIMSIDGTTPECADHAPFLFGTLTRPCCAGRSHTPDAPSDSQKINTCGICQLAATTPHSAPAIAVPQFLKLFEIVPPILSEGTFTFIHPGAHHSRAPPLT